MSAITAQVTQEQADSIIQARMSGEMYPFVVYAKDNLQTEGMVILTSKGENLELDYPCWVYYVKSYTTQTNNSYLIVKESSGNLLEINVRNTEPPGNLKKWRLVGFPASDVTILAPCFGKKGDDILETPRMNMDSIEISYIDGELFIEHYNAHFTCFFEVNVTISFTNGLIVISEKDLGFVDCYCFFDFKYSAGKFEQGTYHLIIFSGTTEVYNQIIKLE
jgi:hypothetical protein